MTRPGRGFVPVLHGATDARPDEADTLVAAEAVSHALTGLGYETEIVGLDLDLRRLEELKQRRPLTIFNLVDALRGDGRSAALVPALLDALGLPYTGSRTRAWLDTLSKTATKRALVQSGLPTPCWSEDGPGFADFERVIVKPVFEHGSLGMDADSVIAGENAKQSILERSMKFCAEHFAEAFIEGREFNVALIETGADVRILPIAEIVFEGFADSDPHIVGYDAKWLPASAAYIGTPRIFGIEDEKPVLAAELQRLALACWRLFGLNGYARVDFRVDSADKPWILEVNVNPCLSPDAGFAAAAAKAGMGYAAMVDIILGASLGALQATA